MVDASPLLLVVALSGLPFIGSVIGGLLSERYELSKRQLGLTLHLAAGAVTAVVAVELMPRALQGMNLWLALGLFLLGGATLIAIDWGTDFVTEIVTDRPPTTTTTGPWLLLAGVALDLFTDGLMIGAGTNLDLRLGLLLGLGLFFAAFFESFAAFATLRNRGIPRKVRVPVNLGLALLIPVFGIIGFVLVRPLPDVWSLGILAWTAGVLLTLVIEEMAPQADVGGEGRIMTGTFLAGFTVFTALAAVFG